MKIAIYTHEFIPYCGGIATYCYELACGFQRRGHSVTVIAPRTASVVTRDLPFDIEWVQKGNGKTALKIRAIRAVRCVIRSSRPDVLLVADRSALISASVFRSLLKVRIVPIVHGSEILSHRNRATLRRRLIAWQMQTFYKTRDLIICGSSYSRDLILDAFPLRPENVLVVLNGIMNRFDGRVHCGTTVRKKLRIPSTTIVLLTIARLTPGKGQDVIIRALPNIIAKHPSMVYICGGKGPYARTLSSLAVENQVDEYVIFTGEIEENEKYAYYDACDLFVMPSRRVADSVEGFGLSFLEAWHASKPVLGGKHGGAVEVIDDGVNGVIVQPEDVEAVEDAILTLVASPSELTEMGRRGHAKACTKFSDLNMVDQIVKALELE